MKALRLSNKARQTTTVGEIVNLMSVDAQCIRDFMPNLHLLWSAPLQVTVSMIFLYFTMGISTFVGLGVMVVLILINAWLGSWSRMLHKRQMAYKDSRVRIINEVLNGIKVYPQ